MSHPFTAPPIMIWRMNFCKRVNMAIEGTMATIYWNWTSTVFTSCASRFKLTRPSSRSAICFLALFLSSGSISYASMILRSLLTVALQLLPDDSNSLTIVPLPLSAALNALTRTLSGSILKKLRSEDQAAFLCAVRTGIKGELNRIPIRVAPSSDHA